MVKIYRVFYHYSGKRIPQFSMDVEAENPKNALENVWAKVGHDIIRDKITSPKNKMFDLNKENRVTN